ncbi:SWIM zinc finger family protein [Cupriavidus basilensis]
MDPYTVSKARSYARALSRNCAGSTRIPWRALCKSTRARPYDQCARISTTVDEDVWVEGECTCPVGVDCKHVAALLIAGLAHQPKTIVPACKRRAGELAQGFRARRTAANPAAKKKPAKATACTGVRARPIVSRLRGDDLQGESALTARFARLTIGGKTSRKRWSSPRNLSPRRICRSCADCGWAASHASYTGGFGLQGVQPVPSFWSN